LFVEDIGGVNSHWIIGEIKAEISVIGEIKKV
jgi:hypothetical protein